MNIFWDFSITSTPEKSPEGQSSVGATAVNNITNEVDDPSRDEILDSSRGGGQEDDESRDEERASRDCERHHGGGDISMFSTLTELLFSPFSDGYCKTPFCSDGDYLPPSCPSGGFYTTPDEVRMKPQQDYPSCDDFGDICKSDSAASGSQPRRRRPLAFAVGHGDEWKDPEGRRVVITPRRVHPPPQSPPRFSSPHRQPVHYSKASTCTCVNPASTNSLVSSETPKKSTNHNNPNESPHQSKSVLCKFCTGLDAPPSTGETPSHPLPPIL